jgi:hypothetical protein
MILLDLLLKVFTMSINAAGSVEGALRGVESDQPSKREENYE